MSVYLDYNASAPIDPRVLEKMIDIYQNYSGNSDSRTHDYGDRARAVVVAARKQVAELLGVDSTEIFFTSGATESNNIAIQGLRQYAQRNGKKHIITTAIEHKAVLESVKALHDEGFDVDIINPDSSGRIPTDEILSKIRDDTLLVSIMHVNNEIGIIQPVKEIGHELKSKSVLFHVDATQSCGKLVSELRELDYSMLTFSAHKLRGPQGVGVLVLRKQNYKLPPVKPIMYGGQQEHGIRPGTVPVALVAGCGVACEITAAEYRQHEEKVSAIKLKLLQLLQESGVKYHLNGEQKYCINSTINICFEGVNSEALMLASKQYCSISNGSACTSKSYAPSYVLMAMRISEEDIRSSVRFSWGFDTDLDLCIIEFGRLLHVASSLGGN